MHEFSLAKNIVEIVEETVTSHNASRAVHVILEIGKLSGVEIEALKIAMEALQPETILEDAEIQYDIIEGLAQCQHCQLQFVPRSLFDPCPRCNEYGANIIEGKELLVKSVTAE